ncbi:MAG TPA: lysozyme [Thermoleophilaceae bacterium]|jgi:lysozyme
MRLDAAGIALLMREEGLRTTPYNDSAGHATIGVGHLIHRGPVTAADIRRYRGFTRADAEKLLRADAASREQAVERLVRVPLSQNEFNALVSLVFNIGINGFASSTVLRKLNAGDRHGAADAFLMWRIGGPGLIFRRQRERQLFLSGGAKADPIARLGKTERRWCEEYDRIRRMKRNEKRIARLRALRRAMARQAAAIKHAAEGESGGWEKENRRVRFSELQRRAGGGTKAHGSPARAQGGPARTRGATRHKVAGDVDWRPRQRLLNKSVRRLKLLDMEPLDVDGVPGPATRNRIRQLKNLLGYSVAKQTGAYDRAFHLRLKYPFSSKYSSEAMLAAAAKRRRRHNEAVRESREKARAATGIGTFDGKPCAGWLVPYLSWARENGWRGGLISGYRAPAHSERICFQKCGQPRCPGRCAGRSSNHSQHVKPTGAIDVSDYVTFARLMRRCPLTPRIFNALGAQDPNHFSSTGR